ncbi:MAG: ABC transporter ATP-binding protein [Fervidicoccaceae archaeon]
MTSVVISAESLWKIYNSKKEQTVALKNISLSIEKNKITTLLGRNGAGKTTFLRIAATQLLPTSGKIEVLGHDAVTHPYEIRERIAVIPQDAKPLLFPSPLEYVTSILTMRGHSFNESKRVAREVLEELGFSEDQMKRAAWNLSGGYQRRLLLAVVLAADAELILLDEPTIGLDPIARRDLWGKISLLKKKNKTILLTTHYMDEAEKLSDKVIIIHNGEKIIEGEPQKLIESFMWKRKIEVLDECDKELMAKYGEVHGTVPPYIIYINDDSEQAINELNQHGCRSVASLTSLEDVFLKSVGEEKWKIIGEE